MVSLPSSEYSIAWICALAVEMTAARAMLDEEHEKPADQDPNDDNNYCLGRIASYNIVITCLPAGIYGVTSAAVVGTRMRQTFRRLKYGLMVGIGGGAPHDDTDIRLGDVVVSKPGRGSGGVIQFDFGKEHGNGSFERVGSLNQPPEELLKALTYVEAEHLMKGNRIPELLESAFSQYPKLAPDFSHQGQDNDLLFHPGYDHCATATCEHCDRSRLVQRRPRQDTSPRVFQGLIASGNQVMKHGATRERLRKELGVICFEMEAAGLMNILPCLVIRGICDYSDSHKNKQWQPYAAMTAAAFASELIQALPGQTTPSKNQQQGVTRVGTALSSNEWESGLELSLSGLNATQVLQMLKAVPRVMHVPRPAIDSTDPGSYWVLKNVDYYAWSKANGKDAVLCLSATDHDTLDSVVSAIQQTHSSESGRISFRLSWTDMFNTHSFSRSFVQAALSVLLESLPADEAKMALLRFLRSVLSNLSSNDRDQLSRHRYTAYSREGFVRLLQTLLGLESARRCAGLMAALMHQHRSFLVVIQSTRSWDSSLLDFARSLNDELRAFGEGSSQLKILVTGTTNTALQDSWQSMHLLHIQYDLERQSCLSTLFFDNTRYSKINDHHRDSLQWLWQHPQYLEWSTSTTSKLFLLEGKPGSGKSTLAKYLRERLRSKIVFKATPVIADFFYSHRDGDGERSHRNMLQGILWNILDQDPTLFYHFQREYRSARAECAPKAIDWKVIWLQRIFLSIAGHPVEKEIFLILDALDESEDSERRDVLTFLLTLCNQSGPCVFRVFMASRPMTYVQHSVRTAAAMNVMRMQDETEADIRTFALSFLGPELRFTGRLLREATEYIVETAEGVFLWVHLIRNELQLCAERGFRKRDVFKKLLDLPTKLEAFYLHMLNNLNHGTRQDTEDGRNMFQLALFAERSLTVTEIQHLLAMKAILENEHDVTEDSFEDELIQSMETRIIHCGGNFLEIKEGNVVQLIHQTVREFLHPNGSAPGERTAQTLYKMDAEDTIHASIARCCLYYLQLIARSERFDPVESWKLEMFDAYVKHLNNWLLLRYILPSLVYHISKASRALDAQGLFHKVLPDVRDKAISHFLGTWLRRNLQQQMPALSNPGGIDQFQLQLLHAATRNSLVEVAEIILCQGASVEGLVGGKSVFQVATMHGSEQMVQFLMNRKADLGVGFAGGRTGLHWAALRGHFEIVKLLSTEYSVNDRDSQGLTPLHLAAQCPNPDIVRFLMGKGARYHTPDSAEQWSPLHWASHHGHLTAMQYLLDQHYIEYRLRSPKRILNPALAQVPPSIQTGDRKGKTAIYLAAANNQPEAVQLLLDHGADPCAKDKDSFTPLSRAAAMGHERVVQRFIDWRPELCFDTDDTERTALTHAAIHGHVEVVQALSQVQNNVNLRSKNGHTALHLATAANQTGIIRLLTSLGASVNERDNLGITPLHIAAYDGYLDSVNTLIECGAGPRALDADRRDALYLAAGQGHTAVVKTLLQHPEARVNAKDRRGWTPLFWAAGNGETEVISLLVQHGGDVKIRDRNGVTSLHWAAWKGQLSSAKLLLDLGADATTLDKNGMSAGDWASQAEQSDIAQLFDVSVWGGISSKLWLEYDKFMPGV